ncbi:recombinase family protein [Peribacillus frigoritolerans]|uniref:recombinase family protein n=1 Tax=Peribacillus frigoritolerans TaxID=450367 RepID=UPI0039A0FB6E
MSYIDVKELYQEYIGVYCRVSTGNQDIEKQISLADIYLSRNNINTEMVLRFIDNNVSANKLSSENRPQFQNLLIEIKKGRLKTVIVQNRDRLARNFYEYVDLVKILYRYNVNLIFTDYSQAQFSKVLSIEALYGIFPQFDGRNISQRTTLTRLQYPGSIFGFNIIGEKYNKKYIPNPNVETELKSFIFSVININSADELLEEFIKYKKLFKDHQKILSFLKNPFYSGHIKIQNEYVALPHVSPIISLEVFLKVEEVLSKCEQEVQTALTFSHNKGLKVPVCSICKTPMNFRSTKLGESGYYVCSKKHPRIEIGVSQYDQLISEHLKYVLNKISVNEIKKDVFTHLYNLEKKHKQEVTLLQNTLISVHEEITKLVGSQQISKLKKLGQQSKSLKEEMKKIHTILIKITDTRIGINSFVEVVIDSLTNELQNYQINHLVNILISKIEVSSNTLIYHTTFGKYIEGKDELDEFPA